MVDKTEEPRPGEAIALLTFMGWLTSRKQIAGPFSERHEASQAAQLVGAFCESQGWMVDDAHYKRVLPTLRNRYPD